jgi:hypothetical protein
MNLLLVRFFSDISWTSPFWIIIKSPVDSTSVVKYVSSHSHLGVQSELVLVCQLRMSRIRPSLVALFAVTIFGLWHIYAAHNARFGSKHYALELMPDVNSNVNDKQTDSLVQEALNRTLESDNQILHKLEELQLENELLRIRTGQIMRHIADSVTQWKPLRDLTKISVRCFISEIISREHEHEGPPELFEFPSALSHGRHLCFKPR